MPRITLTAAVCAAAVNEVLVTGRKTTLWCQAISGFILEIQKSGYATYAVRYTDTHGTQRQFRIGGYRDLTFDKAKKEATRVRSEVVLGNDPAGQRAEKKAIPTYKDLADQHLSDAKLHMKSWKTLDGNLRRHVIPRWGNHRLTDIHQRDVAAWLADLRAKGLSPGTIEKIRVSFGRSFELGKRWGTPGCDRNPTHGIARKPLNNARERFLNVAEAERLRKAVASSSNPLLAPIVGMALLTGARQGEILRAEWQHVSVERKTWYIPMSKTGRSRHVPLSQAMLDLLDTIPKKEGAKYLFPSPVDPKTHITTIKHSWDTARREAKLGDCRFHDLRHSCASFMAGAGIDLLAIGRVLGHASYQSTQRYSHLSQERLLSAVEAGASQLKVDWASTS